MVPHVTPSHVSRRVFESVIATKFVKTKSWREPENQLKSFTFLLLWGSVAILHLTFACHLFALAYAHVAIQSFSNAMDRMDLPQSLVIPSIACALVGILHLYGLWDMLRNRQPRRRVARASFEIHEISRGSFELSKNLCYKLWTWYQIQFADKGPFGAQGHYFALRMEIQQVVSILSQTSQAYNVSLITTVHHITAAYGVCIALSSFVAPAVLIVPLRPVLQRTLAILLPVVLALFLECILPWFATTPYLRIYANGRILSQVDIVAQTHAANLCRRLFLTSLFEVTTRMLPCILYYYSLRYLEWILARAYDRPFAHLKQSPGVRRRSSSMSDNIEANTSRPLLRRLILACRLFLISWGMLILAATFHIFNDPCPSGCQLSIRPFGLWHCVCIALRVNCQAQLSLPPARDQEKIEMLTLVDCPAIEMSSLKAMNALVSLVAVNTSIVNWMHESTSNLKSLSLIRVGNLSYIPWSCLTRLTALKITRSQINSLNLTNYLVPLHALNSLTIHHGQLEDLPPALSQLKHLETLSLRNNSILNLSQTNIFPSLMAMDLSDNPIMALPDSIHFQMPQLHSLVLDRTNLSAIPAIPQLHDCSMLHTPYCIAYPKDTRCDPRKHHEHVVEDRSSAAEFHRSQ